MNILLNGMNDFRGIVDLVDRDLNCGLVYCATIKKKLRKYHYFAQKYKNYLFFSSKIFNTFKCKIHLNFKPMGCVTFTNVSETYRVKENCFKNSTYSVRAYSEFALKLCNITNVSNSIVTSSHYSL